MVLAVTVTVTVVLLLMIIISSSMVCCGLVARGRTVNMTRAAT